MVIGITIYALVTPKDPKDQLFTQFIEINIIFKGSTSTRGKNGLDKEKLVRYFV